MKIILVSIVSLLHFYFMILEMILWTKPFGRKTFKMTPEHAQATSVLAANQGLYNGFLSLGLGWSLAYPEKVAANHISVFFLSCVIIAGMYGGYSVNKRIFFIQSVPAILALIFCLI